MVKRFASMVVNETTGLRSGRIMLQHEFEEFIADENKSIEGNIAWKVSDEHPAAVEFRVELQSTEGHVADVRGWFNRKVNKLGFAIVHRKFGRIYGLDLGREHRNPNGTHVGELHKHRWTEAFGAKDAYVPTDITELVTNPVGVWKQFCEEAKIVHNGTMNEPPRLQRTLPRTP